MTATMAESTTLKDIAVRWPSLIPHLERLGLDYCCGGATTLAEAAAELKLGLPALIRELEQHRDSQDVAPDDRDWSEASMAELADHIEQTHHAFVRTSLARLDGILPRIVEAHGANHPEFKELDLVVRNFADDMHDHMVREERVVFPWLRRLESPSEIQGGPPWSVRRPIDCMIHDHDDAGEALRRIRALTNGYTPPGDCCPTVHEAFRVLEQLERDTHAHIHKENNILFPAGIKAERRREGELTRRRGQRPGAGARSGFTLIELLVVIAIMALLIGLLLPALSGARSAGRSVVCLANTRSIATAMTMYADDDPGELFPTARMPGMPMGGDPAAPFSISWIYLLARYVGVDAVLPPDPTPDDIRAFVGQMRVCQCPEDHSQNWDAVMMPRLASYGINAYLTPNHPPYWGVRASQVREPSHCVLGAELTEEMGMDHFMPMYWGNPPAVVNPMIQARQWDQSAQRPRVIQHTRHGGERANYVFTDGHAGTHAFEDTWEQAPGREPIRNWYDPF